MIDFHTHLDFPEFDQDRPQVWATCTAHLTKVLNVGCDPLSVERTLALLAISERLWGAIGLHPEGASRYSEADWENWQRAWSHPRLVAVGEIGLDYHYPDHDAAAQRRWFERQVAFAVTHQLPIMIHSREAFADTWAVLQGVPGPVIWHCFGYGQVEADQLLAAGHYLSVAGNITYPKAESLRAVAKETPLDHLLVETDAPFLAPQPFRGQRCAPWMCVETGRTVAALKNIAFTQLEEQLEHNWNRLFYKVS